MQRLVGCRGEEEGGGAHVASRGVCRDFLFFVRLFCVFVCAACVGVRILASGVEGI